MDKLYPQFVDDCKATNCGLHYFRRRSITGDMADAQYKEIGGRLTAVRTAFSDLNQKEWADRHAFEKTQWNNWEKGTRRIPIEAAEKLAETYGLTLDFIYRGRRDGLSETSSKVL